MFLFLSFYLSVCLSLSLSLSLSAVLKRFLDVDHVVSLLVQLPKKETVKTAENKITLVIFLKHVLELVEPLKASTSLGKNALIAAFHTVSEDNVSTEYST